MPSHDGIVRLHNSVTMFGFARSAGPFERTPCGLRLPLIFPLCTRRVARCAYHTCPLNSTSPRVHLALALALGLLPRTQASALTRCAGAAPPARRWGARRPGCVWLAHTPGLQNLVCAQACRELCCVCRSCALRCSCGQAGARALGRTRCASHLELVPGNTHRAICSVVSTHRLSFKFISI